MMSSLKKKLRKNDVLKSNYRRLRDSKNQTIDFIRILYFNMLNKKLLYSHYARVKNFGDRFNKDLLAFFDFNLIHVVDYRKSEASLTGSILHMHQKEFYGYVLGSGFIKETNRRDSTNWKIEMLRGPLSAKQCDFSGDCLYADPGILASVIYKMDALNTSKKYKLGVVPHDSDINYFDSFALSNQVKVISVRNSPATVAKEIQECEFIASSSLHGLIFADSYLIPNIHLSFGDRLIGGNHKFQDYYLGMDSEHEFISFNPQLQVNDIVSRCKIRFTSNYIENKQKETIKVYKQVLNNILEERNK